MSLALHAHQIFLIATLAFAAAILIPFWYRPPNLQIRRNIFQVCDTKGCYWTLLPSTASNQTVVTIYPILVACVAIACVGTSLIGLLLGSWYIQRFAGDIGSKWLLVLTLFSVFLSFLLSCGVWSIMLTTNLHENGSYTQIVRLQDFGFSFWINIGASGGYFYAFFIYLICICKNS